MIGNDDLKSEPRYQFFHASCVHCSQMPHSTERGGDLTTLGPRGWTLRTLEEVHDGVDVGLVEDEHDVDEGRGGS